MANKLCCELNWACYCEACGAKSCSHCTWKYHSYADSSLMVAICPITRETVYVERADSGWHGRLEST